MSFSLEDDHLLYIADLLEVTPCAGFCEFKFFEVIDTNETNYHNFLPFWVLGILGEKNFGKYSLFINGENITDTRQSRFGQVVFPPFQNPTFAEIYTHTQKGAFLTAGSKSDFDLS